PPTPLFSGVIPRSAIVFDLPIDDGFRNTEAEYLAVLGGYRVVNGYSGYKPRHLDDLRRLIADHRRDAFDAYRLRWDLYVIIRPTVDESTAKWLESLEGIERLSEARGWRLYRLRRVSTDPLTPLPLPLPRDTRYGRQEFRVASDP